MNAISSIAAHEAVPVSTRASNRRAMFKALFSLSQTQRRLAHRAKREALDAEQRGQLARYTFMRREADRLWNEARWHLWRARQEIAA